MARSKIIYLLFEGGKIFTFFSFSCHNLYYICLLLIIKIRKMSKNKIYAVVFIGYVRGQLVARVNKITKTKPKAEAKEKVIEASTIKTLYNKVIREIQTLITTREKRHIVNQFEKAGLLTKVEYDELLIETSKLIK